MTLENQLSKINEDFFFKEFSFSRNEFTPPQSSELQFSDHVIWLDDLLITFQVKERNKTSQHTQEREERWFRKDVLGKAVTQIKDTLRYLKSYEQINITNARGHSFNITTADVTNIRHVILYKADEKLPLNYLMKKFHQSKSAGFIHLLSIRDYKGICETLLTPHEIDEYFEFRESICIKYINKIDELPEQSLVGQFLSGELSSEPTIYFAQYLAHLIQSAEQFDLWHIIQRFEEHIISPKNSNYYAIIKEIAKLDRSGLREFKIRFDLCVENCKLEKFAIPYRFSVPRTGCGFVFVTT